MASVGCCPQDQRLSGPAARSLSVSVMCVCLCVCVCVCVCVYVFEYMCGSVLYHFHLVFGKHQLIATWAPSTNNSEGLLGSDTLPCQACCQSALLPDSQQVHATS